MTPRDRFPLPQRRACVTFEMRHGDQRAPFQVSIGFFDDGSPGEVFITGAKAGSAIEAVARDGAVLVSIALQYGVPLETLQHTIMRNPDGSAGTIVGAVIDELQTISARLSSAP